MTETEVKTEIDQDTLISGEIVPGIKNKIIISIHL